ncbi:MAG: FG-GAP-like repeat-containing protein [Acidobacteriaceae bacterium]
MSLLTGNGAGGFSPTTVSIGANNLGSWVAVDDFNGDGEPDVAASAYSGSISSLLLNTLNTTATATLSNVHISGTTKDNVVAKFPGA